MYALKEQNREDTLREEGIRRYWGGRIVDENILLLYLSDYPVWALTLNFLADNVSSGVHSFVREGTVGNPYFINNFFRKVCQCLKLRILKKREKGF